MNAANLEHLVLSQAFLWFTAVKGDDLGYSLDLLAFLGFDMAHKCETTPENNIRLCANYGGSGKDHILSIRQQKIIFLIHL